MKSIHEQEFAGKAALITGGTKGLGLATAKLLAAARCDVYLGYRSDEAAAEAAARAIRDETGVRCEAIQADLSEEGGVDRLFDGLAARSKRLDLYVHNAAA